MYGYFELAQFNKYIVIKMKKKLVAPQIKQINKI
jgi:hypothetical protein